jgi:hypothetical protein
MLERDPVCQAHGRVACKVWHALEPLVRLDFSIDHSFRLAMSLGVLAMLAALLVPAARARADRVLGGWAPLALFGVGSYVAFSLGFHGDLSFKPWYFVAQPYVVARLAGAAFEHGRARLPPAWATPASAALAALGLVVLVKAVSHQWVGRSRDPQLETVEWIRGHLPPDAVIGAWNAGQVGFLSGRTVVPLDGLVNSWDYALTRRAHLCEYWRDSGIQYVADTFLGAEALSVVPTLPDYAPCAASLTEVWSDASFGQPWRIAVYRVP